MYQAYSSFDVSDDGGMHRKKTDMNCNAVPTKINGLRLPSVIDLVLSDNVAANT